MRSARAIACILVLAAPFAPSLLPTEDPAQALKRGFDAAKASLAAGNLGEAEAHYKQTIVLGLRQLAALSLSESQLEPATLALDEALKLAPHDLDLRLDAAAAWFRRGDIKKAREFVQGVLDSAPQKARAQAMLGRIEIFRGDFAAAATALKSSVDAEFDFENAYYLGLAHLKNKSLPEAQEWFRQLQARMGDSAALHVLFGRAYLIGRYPQSAIEEFRQAVKLDPQYPRAHGLLGYAYLEAVGEEAYPRARAEFQKELVLRPADYYPLALLGIANVSLRDFPAAESALLRANRVRPREPIPYLYLGEIYSQTNRTRQAVAALQKFIALAPVEDVALRDLSRAHYLLGHSFLRLGRPEDARKELARSRQYREAKFRYDAKHIFDEKRPSDQGESRTSDRIAALLEAGSPEAAGAAQSLVQSGLPAVPGLPPVAGVSAPAPAQSQAALPQKTPPETAATRKYRAFVSEILASSYNDLGVMRAKASQFAAAPEFFKQAAHWKRDLPGIDRNWGLAAYRAELYRDAIPPLERHLSANPNDGFVRQLLGLSYSMLENYAKVVDVLHPFLEHPPNDPGLLFAWGTALVRTRQSDAAAGIFRQLLEQNANNASVHLLLGQAHAQQADYSTALTELKIALQLDPRLPEAHYYAGLIYLHQTEFESAAQEFRAELQLQPAHPLTTYHLGYALLAEGHPEVAVPLFRDVIKALPGYESAHFELGRALLQQGDTAGAIESLETARKLVPDHDATYYQLSQAYRRAGRVQEAEEALATYRKLIEGSRLKKRKSLETEKP